MSNLTLPAGPTVGTHKVLALPVVEQGQVFHDADMSKLAPFLQSQGFDIAINFYDEASHGLLTLSYDLFGWNAGPPGPPLQMPVKTRSFFNPPFLAGGLRSTTTAASATIDGTESLVIRVDSRLADRKGKQLTVPFAALVATVSLGPFPVDITFSGTESCAFDVTKGGQTKHVSLQFTAKTITITTAAEFASLGTHLDGIMNTALTKAGMPGVFASFSVKRSARNPNLVGSIFILLAFNPGGADKGVIANFATSGLSQIGFDTATTGTFAFPGDTGSLQAHLAGLLTVSQAAAGFASDPLLQPTLKISASGSTITIDINLSDQDGGEMASIALISQAGLEALGFDKAAPNPGGTSSFDWANAINDAQGLVNDAFSTALARIGGNADDALNIFGGYNSIMVVFIESPGPAVPAAQQWSVDPVDYSNLRGLFINAKAVDAASTSTTLTCGWIISLFDNKGTPNPALMSHETGHSLGYPDLYFTAEYRRDLLYVNNWSVMSWHSFMPHHCGAIKVHAGWIGGDKGPDGKLSRVVYVATPTPSGPTPTEALLVPNEYWDTGMEAAVQAAFPGVTAKVAQLVHIDLGGDGNQFDIIEARQKGVAFSHFLPASPALIAMNVLDFEDDTRYAVDGKYRRKVQQLNTGFDLVKKGDSFDFASAPALQAAGVSVTILDVVGVTRPAGVVQVFRVRVDRQAADYIDLAFTQTTPYYMCPDVWVDWPGDNSANPANHDQYPVGMPLDQGDAVRVPKTGTELHWAVARVWHFGTIPALNVKVIVYKCDPPGSGDHGQFHQFGSDIIPQVDPQQPVDLPIAWNVGPNDSGHTCILAEIADWTVPDKPGTIIALGSDDLTLSNNHGQKNVSTFVSASASPYPPIDFAYSVSNDGLYLERAYLLPDWLPPGLTLRVWPNLMLIPAKSIGVFKCRFEFDSELLGRYCKTDPSVVISAWRRTPESCERWGSVKYDIDLRTATATTLSAFYPSSVMVSGVVAPDPGGGQVRIRIEFQGQAPDWFTAPLVSGAFQLTVPGGANDTVQAIAMYDGSTIYAPSSSPVANATRVEIK